jgi:quercetin dioxygenase-like cupin family protein
MQITPTPQPVALGPEAAIHLGPELEIATLALTPDYWAHNTDTAPELAHGRILSVFDYTETWSYWERHPVGDELVYLLTGDVELLLDDGRQTRTVALRAGDAAIIPTGTWHRAAVHAPSRLLFVTPTPQRTEQRPAGI